MLHLNTIDSFTYNTLLSLCSRDYLQNFALAGGTSIALQTGHRKSIDIDLFAFADVDMREVALLLENDYSGISINKVSKVFIFCFIEALKCDFVKHSNHKLLRPLINEGGVRMYSLQDLAAMKLNAICGRGTRKDFYDIYQLLQIFKLKDLLEWYDEKFNADNSCMR